MMGYLYHLSRLNHTRMKYLLVVFAMFMNTFMQAQQVAEKGSWILGIGSEAGIYSNEVTTNVFGFEETYTDTAGAFFFPLSVEYCVLNRLSVGTQLRLGKYVDDEDYEDNNTGVWNFSVAYHFLKKERNDLYARIAFGPANLRIENNRSDATGEWRGGHFGVGLGYRHYFGKTVGVHLYVQNGAYTLRQESLSVGNLIIDPDLARWDMVLRGPELGFGLNVKF